MISLDDLLRRLDAKKAKNGSGHTAKCPGHEDSHASLSIGTGEDGRVLLHCFAGCTTETICDALKIKVADLFPEKSSNGYKRQVTVAELAAHKRLPAAFLRDLGVHDLPRGGVGIPYRDADGKIVSVKGRSACAATKGSWWERGKPIAYGIDRLLDARELDYVVIVEGESDCWTLWHHEIPALGVPGANMVHKTITPELLNGIAKVYAIREPDDGGDNFIAGLVKQIGADRFLEVRLDGAKDPSNLHMLDAKTFREKFEQAIASAKKTDGNHTQNGFDSTPAPLPFRLASDIPIVPIKWVWRGRIAAGMLTVFDADPGLGKSTVTSDWGARITRGLPMPGETEPTEIGGAIYTSFEEHQGAVMVPRLQAAGADLTKVAIWNLEAQSFDLLSSLPTLADIIRAVNAKLVVIDPLMAAMPPDLNAHRDQDVRTVLAPLATLAENTGAAIIFVRHLNKQSGGAALYRGGGSIGIIGAARTGLTLNRDPDLDEDAPDDGTRILAVSKCNVGRMAPSLKLRLVPAPSPMAGVEVARVEWGGTCKESADSLLQPREDRGALGKAVEVLRDLLAEGPILATDGAAALKAMDIASRTATRARQRMGIIPKREGVKGPWRWYLPEHLQPKDRLVVVGGDDE